MRHRRNVQKKSGSSRKKPQQILIFAEDKHDSDAIKCLVEALNPKLRERTQLVVQRDPSSLTREALPVKVQEWMERVADIVAVKSAIADIVGVLVHQDSDAPDNDNVETLQVALSRNVSKVAAYPVVPVQEMESWWFLFPESLRAVKPGVWRDVRMPININVETISNPKEDLVRRTRAAAPKQAYAEADSLAVAQQIASAISRGDTPINTSKSWSKFTDIARSF